MTNGHGEHPCNKVTWRSFDFSLKIPELIHGLKTWLFFTTIGRDNITTATIKNRGVNREKFSNGQKMGKKSFLLFQFFVMIPWQKSSHERLDFCSVNRDQRFQYRDGSKETSSWWVSCKWGSVFSSRSARTVVVIRGNENHWWWRPVFVFVARDFSLFLADDLVVILLDRGTKKDRNRSIRRRRRATTCPWGRRGNHNGFSWRWRCGFFFLFLCSLPSSQRVSGCQSPDSEQINVGILQSLKGIEDDRNQRGNKRVRNKTLQRLHSPIPYDPHPLLRMMVMDALKQQTELR